MVLNEVVSSNISRVGYDPVKMSMVVQYLNGNTYKYINVPYEVYEGLLNAESKGRYMNEAVKNKYLFTKL